MKLLQLKNLWEGSFLSFTSIMRVLFVSKKFISIKKNTDQRKSLLILGNGPSLVETIHQYKIAAQPVTKFCVNFMAQTPVYEELQPQYYLICAPELFTPNAGKSHTDRGDKLLATINDKTTWEMTLFLPVAIKKYKTHQRFLQNHPKVKVKFYNHIPFEGYQFLRHWFFALNLGMPRPHNVLIPSIMLGINMNYKKIILLGSEHSWLEDIMVDKENNVLLNQKRFYSDKNASFKPMHKRGKGQRKLHEVLEKFYITFKSHFLLRYYADSKNVTIYNASPSSYIDAYPKKAFDQIDI